MARRVAQASALDTKTGQPLTYQQDTLPTCPSAPLGTLPPEYNTESKKRSRSQSANLPETESWQSSYLSPRSGGAAFTGSVICIQLMLSINLDMHTHVGLGKSGETNLI